MCVIHMYLQVSLNRGPSIVLSKSHVSSSGTNSISLDIKCEKKDLYVIIKKPSNSLKIAVTSLND